MAIDPHGAGSAGPGRGPRDGADGAVLLVEDEALVALDGMQLLGDHGYEVVGPVAGLDQAIAAAAGQPRLAAAILDVNLAGGKSWPVARMLKDRGVPFLFLSGYLASHADIPSDLEDCLVLSKPVDPSVLLRTLDRLSCQAP